MTNLFAACYEDTLGFLPWTEAIPSFVQHPMVSNSPHHRRRYHHRYHHNINNSKIDHRH